MICKLTNIQQPVSGEFEERIYDVESRWNSGEWSWIKFEEDDLSVWCGEFRGSYRGAVLSEKFGAVAVLTSDCLYVLDVGTGDVIDCESQSGYIEITCTPFGDILLNNGYALYIFKGKNIASLEYLDVPTCHDWLRFIGYEGNILKINCEEVYDNCNELLLMDCETLDITVDGGKR